MWSFTNNMFSINKFLIGSFVIFVTLSDANATQTDIAKVTENVKFISQNIANEYLYLYNDSKKTYIKDMLQNDIKKLEDDYRIIARNSNDSDIKNVLDFLSYNKDQIKEILEDEISKENVSTILDLSNTLLEGANQILSIKNHDTFDAKFHIMKISKLYMATKLNYDKEENQNLLNEEIKLFDEHVTDSSWLTLKDILDRTFVPNIVYMLVKNIKNTSSLI